MKLEPLDNESAAFLMPQDEKARRRSNTAPDGKPGITPEELAEGVTLEQLQSLPVPVLAYQTQITIHGQFPPVSSLCKGYHLLTRNANGSLGVRYAGIDAGKKQTAARAIRLASSPWSPILDSQGLTLQRRVDTPAIGREALAGIPSGIYGNAGLFRCPMSGFIYAVVSVGAIRATDLWSIIVYFAPGMASPEALAMKEAEAEAARATRNAEAETLRKVEAEARTVLLEAARVRMVEEGAQAIPAPFNPAAGDSFRVLSIGYDNAPRLTCYTLAKRGPVLCIVHEGAKGRKVEDHHHSTWRRAAAAGLIFTV